MKKMTHILEILEDQIFLLNNIRLVKSHKETVYDYLMKNKDTLSNIFLSFHEIIKCKNIIKEHLIDWFQNKQIDNEWNINVNVFLRGLCNCLILIKEIHMNSHDIFQNSYLGMSDIDKLITNISVKWTTKSSADIINDIKILLGFAYTFGSLHCLPIGFGIENIKCFLCRKNNSISTGKTEKIINTCTHIFVEIPFKFDVKELFKSNEPTSIFEIKKENIQSSSSSSSLGYKLKSFEIKKEMNNVKDIMYNISEKYNNLELEKQHLLSLKCISPYLYQLLGFYIHMISKRLHCLSLFTDNKDVKITNMKSCKERLETILKDIKFSKLNMMCVREEFSKIYLCPFSFYDEKCNILRRSIVLKKSFLASGMNEECVDNMNERMLRITLENLSKRKTNNTEDDIYFVLFVFLTYNTWLSMQKIEKCFRLKWIRSELYNSENVIFLYEKNKIGTLFEDGGVKHKMLFNYNQAVEICVHHMHSLYNKGICSHSLQIQNVLGLSLDHRS